MEDGGWRMEDGGWRMEEGGRKDVTPILVNDFTASFVGTTWGGRVVHVHRYTAFVSLSLSRARPSPLS
jgi:hypothetical protein